MQLKMAQYSLSTQIDPNKIFLVKHSELEERFDPAFYKPEYTNLLSRHKKWNRCKDISRSIQHPPEYERIYSEKGIQLIRSQNVRPSGLNLNENPVFFSADFLKGKKVIFPAIGDVLIVRSGVNAGDVATIDKNITSAIIGADNLLLKPDESKVLPKFIQVYFNTNAGRSMLNRYLTGATNTHISPYYLSRVQIPEVSKENQRICVKLYEDGLSSKQQKEAESKALLESIDSYLLEELRISLPEQDNSLGKRIFTTKFNEVTGGRLDPDYHTLYYKYLQRAIGDSKFTTVNLSSITDVLKSGKTPSSTQYSEKETKFPIIKVGSYTGDYIDLAKVDYVMEKSTIEAHKEDIFILSAAHQSEYVGKHIKYLEVEPNIVTSYVGELICVRTNEKCNSLFLFSLLCTKIYKTLINREKTGQTSHIYGKDLKYISIPLSPLEKQNEMAEHIQNLRSKAKALQQEAVRVLEEAKGEVERMIIGE